MHKSRLGGLIIDCQTDNLDKAKEFWTGALGYESVQSSDTADGRYVTLNTASDEPHIELQKIDHPSGVHIDIETNNVDAEVARLEKLGAITIKKVRTWWIMEAPTGHRFCVVEAERSDFDQKANSWD